MPSAPSGKTILIAGPTASGKSAAALAIAEKFGGEIVNADALQVYNDLRILSARPPAEDLSSAVHHLYGHVDGAVRYSAGEWSRDAAAALADIHARGRCALFVGGTGLYFRALEQGLAETPTVPDEVRREAAKRYDEIGAEAFRLEVLAFDPAMARLDPSDRQRHIRAWEVFHAGGAPLSDFQNAPGRPVVDKADIRIVIDPPRERLYAAIETRYDGMIAAGAIDEARALAARGLDPELPVMKAVGAAELIAHLAGQIGLDAAIDLAKRNSRRFAKRQLTWFRRQTPDWMRAATPEDAVRMALAQP